MLFSHLTSFNVDYLCVELRPGLLEMRLKDFMPALTTFTYIASRTRPSPTLREVVVTMGWNAVVGATVTGVVAVNLYNLYQRHRHYGGISAQAYTTEVLPLAKAHVIVGPVVMTQTRWGLLDLFCGGLRSINAYHPAALSCEPFPGASTTIAS